MDIPSLPRYPGGPDPGPPQRERHAAGVWSDHAALVAAVLGAAAVLGFLGLVYLIFRFVPMPVLI